MNSPRSGTRASRYRRAIVAASLTLAILVSGCAGAAPEEASLTPTAVRLDDTTYELDASPGQLLLAGRAVYFAAAGQRVYRLDLETAQVRQVAASSYYPDGALDSYRLALAGDWLIYLEVSAASNGQSWTLAAKNMATGESAVIDQAVDDRIGWPGPEVAADGDWVVWTRKEAAAGAAQSRLHACNVRSGERRVLGEALDVAQEAWGWPDLDGGRLVVERDGTDPANPTASVELIDLQTGAATRLSGPGPASEPATDGRYVAWKAGPRFGQGKLVVYDLDAGEARAIDLEVEYPQSGDGQVVVWTEGGGLVRVDAAGGGHKILVAPQEGSSYPLVASVDGGRVAWLEPSGYGRGTAKLHVVS